MTFVAKPHWKKAYNELNHKDNSTTWKDRASVLSTSCKIKEVSEEESPFDGKSQWWSYKLSDNDQVVEGSYCGTKEDLRKHLNFITGKLNKRPFI